MKAYRTRGINTDKELYPFKVEIGNRGSNDYQVFKVTQFMGCICGRINCHHVQAVRDMVLAEQQQEMAEIDAEAYANLAGTGRL